MKLDDAIKTALEFETGVHRIYLEAMEKTADPAARRVFGVLCEEELGHLEFLKARLEEWQKTGKVKAERLETSIPGRKAIEKALQDLRKSVEPKPSKQIPELESLKKALDAEIKASEFYKDMVAKLDSDGQALFKRFVEIEEGHEAIVRAEINSVTNRGFWFDIREIRPEGQ
jgi:rubrerythrin